MKSEPSALLSTIYSLIFCCDSTFHCRVTVLSEFNFPIKLSKLTGSGARPIKVQPDGKPKPGGFVLLEVPQLAELFTAALTCAAVASARPQPVNFALSRSLAFTPGVGNKQAFVPDV